MEISNNKMEIVLHRKIYFIFSGLLVAGSLFSLTFWGLDLGIDFTGGSLIEVSFNETRPSNSDIKEKLGSVKKNDDLGQIKLQPAGEKGLIIRLKDISEETHQEIIEALGRDSLVEKRFESIGPLIGQELKKKALWAIIIALLFIVVYIAWAFRRVSRLISSWQYGMAALIALFHDVLITLGFFSVLSQFSQVEIGLPFVAAFLTILGYSVNNSIVIFDRLRENILKVEWSDFGQIVNRSVNQSLARCLNTALTTLLVLVAIFFLGGETIKYFSLALIIGIIIGTYSSIFVTASLIVGWREIKKGSH